MTHRATTMERAEIGRISRQGFTYRWLRRENIARAADLVGTLKM
jgi:hypothetical protein